jgi:hypothetical protein
VVYRLLCACSVVLVQQIVHVAVCVHRLDMAQAHRKQSAGSITDHSQFSTSLNAESGFTARFRFLITPSYQAATALLCCGCSPTATTSSNDRCQWIACWQRPYAAAQRCRLCPPIVLHILVVGVCCGNSEQGRCCDCCTRVL